MGHRDARPAARGGHRAHAPAARALRVSAVTRPLLREGPGLAEAGRILRLARTHRRDPLPYSRAVADRRARVEPVALSGAAAGPARVPVPVRQAPALEPPGPHAVPGPHRAGAAVDPDARGGRAGRGAQVLAAAAVPGADPRLARVRH